MTTPDFMPTDINPDFQLIISQVDGELYICPSRRVSRRYLLGVLQDMTFFLSDCMRTHLDPKDCVLNYALSVIPPDQFSDDDFWDDGDDSDDDGDGGVIVGVD